VVVIDGVAFAPELLLKITRPDPTEWIRFERMDDDTVRGHTGPVWPEDA
jgi:hypothetical protein